MEQDLFEAIETAEKGLDAFLEDRARKMKADRRRVAMWEESVKEYNRKRAKEQRQMWIEFHEEQIARHRATFSGLIDRHEKRLAALRTPEEEEA